ncbi:Nrd1 complex RNA-binding subunit [Mactra antiquata]
MFGSKSCTFLHSIRYIRKYTSLSWKISQQTVRYYCKMAKSSETSTNIVKSLNDKREYRLICLDNGLRALLISDLDGEDQNIADDDSGKESDSENESMASDASDDEMNVDEVSDEEEEIDDDESEKKSAAALCIGVGSFSDPDDIPGFAHFLEHMVFMGSKKYPKENEFDDYLSKHGGHTNAWTDHERTCFYFEVEREYFRKSLDKFAQFFVAPLLLQDSVDREIQAVDSEFQERIPSDTDRLNQILVATAKQDHPMAKFLMGNLQSLKIDPEKQGIDVYGRLRNFFDRNYTAQYMTLAVHSKHNLDSLESMVRESFSDVHNNNEEPLTFSSYLDPFKTSEFKKIYKVVPVEKTHKLYITWPLPPLQKCYRTKPLDYISNLLNHEGKGSIYSHLKKKMWAVELLGGNTGEGYDMNTTWTGFDVCVTLTDEGLKHWQEVVKVIFVYLDLLKKEGPQDWFYTELKQIEETKFRWKEKGDPTGYVEKLADNMQLYPPEDYLTGHKLLFTYDEQIIKDCMNYLAVDNCNIMLTSTCFTENDCPLKEKWFGTSYSVEDITSNMIDNWLDIQPCDELFLPKPNSYIATDFTLKEVPKEDLSSVPQIVSSSSSHKLFYKKDTKFNVPKGFINLNLKSHIVREDLKSATLLDLLIAILNQNISEPTYPAIVAGYRIGCHINMNQTGMIIELSGFNHKIQDVLQLVFDVIINFECSNELFTAMKSELKKTYHNDIMKPSTASRQLRWMVTERSYWSHAEKYNMVDQLTIEDLSDFISRYLSQVLTESLVVGNFTKQEAIDINDSVLSRLQAQTNVNENDLKNNLIEIPRQKMYCQIRSFNPGDTMSCIHNYYQCQPGSIVKCCLNDVLVTRMTEPCFDTLRTKQQLGYSVGCVNHLTCGIIAIGITVEYPANKFSMQYVDEQIEKFLNQMNDILKNITEEEFKTMIESEITLRKTEDTLLEEEAVRYWGEVVNETYIFDRLQKEIEILKTLKLKSLKKWFQEHYFGENQRKISFQVVGKTDQEIVQSSDETDHQVKLLIDPDQSHILPIEDIQSFKALCQHLPSHKVTS